MAIDHTVELSVSGMSCGHCAASVKEELSEVPGVQNIDVNLRPNEVSTVTFITDTGVDDDAVRAAISEAGYELVGISRNS